MKEKIKGGRPFLKDEEDKKDQYITLRISKKEKEDFSRIAKFHNCKPSEYLRNLAYKELGVFVKKKPDENTQELRKELRKIGININQISIKAHQNKLDIKTILMYQKSLILLEKKLEEI